jgi:putative SOS response-associated peptidase YedK
MCGRIVWRFDPRLQQWVKDWLDDEEAYAAAIKEPAVASDRFNITPGSRVPIAMAAAGDVSGGDRHVVRLAKWGFPINDGKKYIFNTRIENAFESPMWRGSIATSRCVVPVTGFYEWKTAGKTKRPFFIHRSDGQPMLLAGISGWRQHLGETIRYASILTCPPNELMSKIHDRMPVILESRQAAEWTAPLSVARILELAIPATEILLAHPVATKVNSQAAEGSELIRPMATLGDPFA